MRKIIIATLVLLSWSLASSVFAQTTLDLTKYDENGFRLDQNIPELIKNRAEQRGTSTLKQESLPLQNNVLKGELASCFDYYTFGDIKVNLTEDTETYSPGDPVVLNGKITNDNPYPIIDLTIRGRLVKDTPNPVYLRSEIITLEDFILLDNVSIPANSSIDVNYTHLLPLNSPKGEYQIFFYAYDNDRFSQSGLSYTNDVVASQIDFSVSGNSPEHVYLDQTRITLNDKEHNVMAFVTNHNKDEAIKINIPLVNPSNEDEEMTVVYTLYKWDGLRKENIVDTKTETITVPTNNEKLLTYTISKTDTSVYFLNIKADNKTLKKDKSVYDVQTESNIRFSVLGYDFPIIDSFGINTYPIKKNSEVTLFTCFHSGAFQDTPDEFSIETQILDNKGKILSETEYQGKINKKIKAIINKFTPPKDLSNFKIVTIMKDSNGNLIDIVEDEYKCEDLDPTLCLISQSFSMTEILSVVFALLALILIIILIKKMKSKTPTMMFVLLLLISSFILSPNDTEASTVTYSYPPFYRYVAGGGGGGDSYHWTLNFEKKFNFIRENGIKTTENFQLDVGKSVAVENNPTIGSWFLTGEIDNSPPMDGVVYSSGDDGVSIYGTRKKGVLLLGGSAAVSVPIERGIVEINSDNPGVVSCTNSGCTAISPGTANVTVKFINDSNVGGFGFVNAVEGFIDGVPEDSFSVVFSFNNIVYTVTVTEVVNTPQTQSCSGVTNISETGATINWSYSDDDNDPQTNYQIQIATDAAFTNMVQSIVPPANTDISSVRSVIVSGLNANTTYYARVKTYNNTNNWSTESTCSGGFTTLIPPITANCTASPISTTPGQSITWTATNIFGGMGTYTFLWSWTDNLTGTTNPLSKIYTTVWSKTASVLITSGRQTKTVSCPAVTVATDLCLNFEGIQTTVPTGFTPDAAGNCVCMGPTTGTLTATDCIISAGASTCNTNLVWDTTNPVGTSAVTTPVGITILTANNSTWTPYALTPGPRNFFLYNNAIKLSEATATATCAVGTTWNGTMCLEDAVPTVTVTSAISITSTAATLRANVTSLGIPAVLSARGICWGTTPSPTNCEPHETSVLGLFAQYVEWLSPGTTYYYRGYATNATGTGYSSDTTFTTKTPVGDLTVTDCTILAWASSCQTRLTWSTAYLLPEKDTAVVTPETGPFTVSTNLSGASIPYTIPHGSRNFFLYHNSVQLDWATATATCAAGTKWNGTICEADVVPTVIAPTATGISGTIATLWAKVTSLGIPAAISARGTCWSLSENPGLWVTGSFCQEEWLKTTWIFTHLRSWFTPLTTYHYRGYATNTTGTGYSPDATFRTTAWTTGTLTASDCTILAGASTCDTTLVWDTQYPVGVSQVGAPPAWVATANRGTTTYPISHGSKKFYLINNAVEYANATATATCIDGTKWNGTICEADVAPTVILPTATGVYGTTATLWAKVTSLGIPAAISARGTCWSLSENPGLWVTGSFCQEEWLKTTWIFTHLRSWFTPLTTYHYRGYATNTTGTGYSPDATFRTTAWTTGTLTASDCTILSGARTCNTNLVWNTTNPVGVSQVGTPPTWVATANSGRATHPVSNGSTIFRLINNAVEYASATATARCIDWTTWNGTICTSAPKTFAITDASVCTNKTLNSYKIGCDGSGQYVGYCQKLFEDIYKLPWNQGKIIGHLSQVDTEFTVKCLSSRPADALYQTLTCSIDLPSGRGTVSLYEGDYDAGGGNSYQLITQLTTLDQDIPTGTIWPSWAKAFVEPRWSKVDIDVTIKCENEGVEGDLCTCDDVWGDLAVDWSPNSRTDTTLFTHTFWEGLLTDKPFHVYDNAGNPSAPSWSRAEVKVSLGIDHTAPTFDTPRVVNSSFLGKEIELTAHDELSGLYTDILVDSTILSSPPSCSTAGQLIWPIPYSTERTKRKYVPAGNTLYYCVSDAAGNVTPWTYSPLTAASYDGCFADGTMSRVPTLGGANDYVAPLITRMESPQYGYSLSDSTRATQNTNFRTRLSQNINTYIKNLYDSDGIPPASINLNTTFTAKLKGWSTLNTNGYYYFNNASSPRAIVTVQGVALNSPKVLLVEGADVQIDGNITYASGTNASLVIIARKNSDGVGGNIYVHPTVTRISATLIADGALMNGINGASENWLDHADQLTRPLIINGRLSTYNTRGGSLTVLGQLLGNIGTNPGKCFTGTSFNPNCNNTIAASQDLERFRVIEKSTGINQGQRDWVQCTLYVSGSNSNMINVLSSLTY